jgi:two-component system, OmpR family, KDP operon response regulator KdpE
MSHVLLVEDDPAVLQVLQAMAEFGGFTSSQAVSATEALQRIKTQSFDAILLDSGVQDLGGPHLIEAIRAVSDVPLIVVSGKSDQQSIIAALDAGADDYVAKPFMPGELLARIRAALRRYAVLPRDVPKPVKSSGKASRRLRRGTKADLLVGFLRSRQGELVRSDEIISAVWGADKKRTERNLRVLLSSVRRELKAQGQPFEIINEHGRGYRLVPHHIQRSSLL